LCKWLEIDRETAEKRFFWIQRANCFVSDGKGYAFQHCSSKYILRAIKLVKPKLIIILGKAAAEYFYQFEKLEEVAGEDLRYVNGYDEYHCVVFYHPSGAAEKWRKSPVHRKAVELVKAKLGDSG